MLPVTANDFEIAFSNRKSSVGKEDIAKHEEWMNQYGAG
jgi:hypothetical protein